MKNHPYRYSKQVDVRDLSPVFFLILVARNLILRPDGMDHIAVMAAAEKCRQWLYPAQQNSSVLKIPARAVIRSPFPLTCL